MKTLSNKIRLNVDIKKWICALYFITLGVSNLLSAQNNLYDILELDFSYHIIDRRIAKDVFLKWNEFDLQNTVYINNTIVGRNNGARGLFLQNVAFPFELRIVQHRLGEVMTDKVFTLTEKDISITDVSTQLYNRFLEWESSGLDLFSFFNADTSIPNEELFSFYQSFLGLSPSEMNAIFGTTAVTSTSRTAFADEYWRKIGGPTGPDTINPEETCVCKMIKTNSSALNLPNGNPAGAASPLCNQATPTWQNPEYMYSFSDFLWPTLFHLEWSAGLIGASKFGSLLLAVHGCKNTGLRRKTVGEGGLGASIISFRMACYLPQNLVYSSKCKCKKLISVNYAYTSHVKAASSSTGGPFCDRKSKIKIEDYAILTSTPGTGTATSLNSGIALVSSACDNPQDTNFISNVSDLSSTLGTILQSGTAATQILSGVGSVGQFFANQMSSSGVCSAIDTSYTLMTGNEMFVFNSAQRLLTLTIISRANFEGQAQGSAAAFGAINSSFYMSAVLETEFPSKICCQEKIGSYVLGTMMGFPINNSGPANNMSTGHIPDLGTLQAYVGSFIGLYSPWGGNFQGSGCCDDVLVDCYSRCVDFIDGECRNIAGGGIDDPSNEIRSKSNESDLVSISPVPIYQGNILSIKCVTRPQTMELYDIRGSKLIILDVDTPDITLQTYDLDPGLYFIKTTFENQIIIKKVIIQ